MPLPSMDTTFFSRRVGSDLTVSSWQYSGPLLDLYVCVSVCLSICWYGPFFFFVVG